MPRIRKGLAKTKAVAKVVRSGSTPKILAKAHEKVRFRKPKTRKLARAPKYPRKSAPATPWIDEFGVIKHPLTTESAMKLMEDHNTLVFIVDVRSDKRKIRQAVAKLYGVQASKVNTLIRPDGKKKAFVRLAANYDALDVANKIGII
ncbi:60S ribosomal protein L23A [Cyanidioschyzon merolae strain 10D]|jgi:large subunit ribosomal protein L23Ae|uniref:60S ribosomal protein L23A n=1 Tax=Cyanidioschyzon merolae (strain NIES-3377 / 10D) TaxID=280699 RepID=M1V5G2_CYAM1|nr:60S ribosomal protein L23A [Cyanidioschyzon merolae strain 10D]BAM80615.1 60S ribosomal protein L23A [Cyanidioschyzon merolae strain 10D]|eukprot:XP_005536651.1 60S ribosomal protein L23A [Cyanidioschyzon merolae strain 10D]